MNESEFYTSLNDFKNSALKFVKEHLNEKQAIFQIHVNPVMSSVQIEVIVKERLENIKFT